MVAGDTVMAWCWARCQAIRVRSSVQALHGELSAKDDDHLNRRNGDRVRAAVGPPGFRIESGRAFGAVAGDELRYPPFRDPVVAGDRGLGSSLDYDSGDD